MKQSNDNTEKRISILACPKCRKPMYDIIRISDGGRKKIINSICDCGYSLKEVPIPEGPLVERLTK